MLAMFNHSNGIIESFHLFIQKNCYCCSSIVFSNSIQQKATNTLRFMKTHTMDHNICYERVNEMFPYFEGFRGTNMCTNMDDSAALNEGFEGRIRFFISQKLVFYNSTHF